MVKIKGDRSMFIYLAIIDSPEGKLKFEVIYERYKGLMFHTAIACWEIHGILRI